MLEKISVKADEFLNTQPERNVDSISNYIKQAKLLRSDLKAVINSAQAKLGTADYITAAGMIEEIDMKLPVAEAYLDTVRNERPLPEPSEFDDFGEMDVQASVNELAHFSALATIGQSPVVRLSRANADFTRVIEDQIPNERAAKIAREIYNEKLSELIRLPDRMLVEAVNKEFPTNEWIGKDPESAEERMHTVFEDESNHPPEAKDIDSEFEGLLDKERSHRGIQKAETQYKKSSAKTADYADFRGYLKSLGLKDSQVDEAHSLYSDDEDHADYDPEYRDYDPNPHGQGSMSDSWIDPESGEQRLGGKTAKDEDDDKDSGKKDKLPNDKMKEKAKETEEKSDGDNDDDSDKDDKKDNLPPWLKKKDKKESSKIKQANDDDYDDGYDDGAYAEDDPRPRREFATDESYKSYIKGFLAGIDQTIGEEESLVDEGSPSDDYAHYTEVRDRARRLSSKASSSSEPATTGEGATLPKVNPQGGEAFEKEIEKEQGKGQKAPRGPNRRTNKDVPAYSSSPKSLTSSLVKKVQASLEAEGFNADYETSHRILEMYLSESR